MNYYLGVDIGTTAVKAVGFSATGETLAKHSCSYTMYHPQPGWSEQKPAEILQAITESINKILTTLGPAKPILVSFSAAMHTFIAINEKGEPLTNCIIWADNRAALLAEDFAASETGIKFYHTTGVPIHAMSPLSKLLWFKKNEPAIFEKAFKFIGIKEYLFFKLFGEYVVDTSIASATGFLNIRSLQWDETILDYVGISTARLSRVVNTKELYSYKAGKRSPDLKLGILPENTPFIIGSSDGALANLGTGVLSKHSMVATIGTSAAARIITREAETDEAMRTFCYHVKDDLYIRGGASNNGGIVFQWLKETLLQTKESYQDMFQAAQQIAPGCDDLLFLPYILGERAPIWNSHAKGVFFGLTINHTKAHLTRAVMEGVIYSLYSIGKVVMEKNMLTDIHTTGVFTNNPLWLQILADIFNTPVKVSDAMESSALGAVLLGMEATGEENHFKRKVLSVYEPVAANQQVYMERFEKFERIYELLKNEFSREATPVHQLFQ
jgi:gluconokinase